VASKPAPSNRFADTMLRGAYVSLDDLLAVRYRPGVTARRRPPLVSNQHGHRLSKLRGRGVDFSEVRAYQPGDDVRTIDWRVTARKNKPHTKVFREERERLTFVVVDQSQGMFFGSRTRLKSVVAAEVAAWAAWQGLSHNDRVGGIVLGNHRMAIHKPYRSSRNVARLMSDIASFNQSLTAGSDKRDENILHESLVQLRRLTHTNHRIFLISDFRPLGDLWQDTLRALVRHNEVVVVQVYDPLERDLPPSEQYSVTDGVARVQFHTGDRRLRDQYHQRFAEHERALQELCIATSARYRTQSTDDPMGILEGA